ncbi:cysteine hydrolase family protein [Escherichia coli]|uniref:cysteine hydrolase family protein n=4 Tax=Enterobacteriaceae TaxID=543 RepID=UPI00200B4B0C|nr:isochorismatase family protein [Escherichia coli]
MLFPNFSLGEEYEHAPPATNRQISPYLPSGRFRTGLPVEGLAIERGDLFYACPRASVFYGTALDADLRTRGVSTLVMAGISTTGVVLSSVAWASDADYDVRFGPGLLLRPGSGCPRSSVAFRVRRDVYRSCNFRASHDRGHSRRWIGARQGQSKSGCGHSRACNSQKPIAVAEVL